MKAPEPPGVKALLGASAYSGYLYAYPHKSAYRALPAPVSLAQLWEPVDQRALFLYIHVPFCEMRCGFCNLFTKAKPKEALIERYLEAIEREARDVQEALPKAQYKRFALGGGTPTLLDVEQLSRLLDIRARLGVDLRAGGSVETSPQTSQLDKLQLLKESGFDRISIGIQSFVDEEVKALKRPQLGAQVRAALDRIREVNFRVLNLDLIYGQAGQSVDSWRHSLEEALRFSPEELFLYPLYVRPLTGLSRGRLVLAPEDEHRLKLYRAGRDFLLERGYSQVSMRMFRRADIPQVSKPPYRCQEDGMVGLGVGARSYTPTLHYSSEYAVGAAGVQEIIEAYAQREDFRAARYGITLDAHEQQRRYVILSLLHEGLELSTFEERFGSPALSALPQLNALLHLDWAKLHEGWLRLTPSGLERSDQIGPWLRSDQVRALMDGYALR